jgi:hypothetical protein
MTMRKLMICTLAFLATATMAFGGMGAEVRGLLALPMGDFGDAAGMGFGGGAKFIYGMDAFNIGVGVDYVMFGEKEEGMVKYSNIPIRLDFAYMFMPAESEFNVYADAFVGFNMLSWEMEILGETMSESESKFGFGGGLGFMYMMSPTMALDMLAAYNHVLTEGDALQYIEVDLGLIFFFGGEEEY